MTDNFWCRRKSLSIIVKEKIKLINEPMINYKINLTHRRTHNKYNEQKRTRPFPFRWNYGIWEFGFCSRIIFGLKISSMKRATNISSLSLCAKKTRRPKNIHTFGFKGNAGIVSLSHVMHEKCSATRFQPMCQTRKESIESLKARDIKPERIAEYKRRVIERIFSKRSARISFFPFR